MAESSVLPSSTPTIVLSKSSCVKPENYAFRQITFLVEGCLFRVPRLYFERESEFFRTTFQLPQESGRALDGDSDEQPFRLDDVKKADFKALLGIMYPKNFQSLPIAFTVDQWTSVLKLSTMWEFDKIRNLSIERLKAQLSDPIQKLVLARRYEIESWKLPAIRKLVERRDPITLREGMAIGIEAALKIASIRECCCRNNETGEWVMQDSRLRAESEIPGLADRIKTTFGL
ncbi:hypothetical protein BDN72DRAFT_833194 [Pluteus cervinus]|uniref:Uncharacterized protein n=1 Tax=Pluteus cervinus TaxID=181527 RepID=A0ACD3BAN0_9AGAR|nr:hypothetical protein BDN72DRAFT_833194 [Pluteus cervinus]